MHFTGHCVGSSLQTGGQLAGALTLHGVTRQVVLDVVRDGTHVTATGMLLRRDYAIGGLPGMVGQHIRFRLAASLPAGTTGIHG
jgi:polyisoprenoid-binding protein YceI